MRIFLFVFIFIGLLPIQNTFAQNSKDLKLTGEQFYIQRDYKTALSFFERYLLEKKDDAIIILKTGHCYYETNQINEAIKFFQYLRNQKKPYPEATLFIAKAYHHQFEFAKAITFYKEYLKITDKKIEDRAFIHDAIKRCAFGLKLNDPISNIIVENLGSTINSQFDEFGLVLSPNYDSKIYFSAINPGNIGGKRNQENLVDEKNGNYCSDIYSCVKNNGSWEAPEALSSLTNSSKNDIIQDFGDNGNLMYYFSGLQSFSGDILVDTFKTFDKKSLFPSKLTTGPKANRGDQDLFIHQDSFLIFSSRREGGYGGYDLYYTKRVNGTWQDPVNFGPIINSSYDERTPYLTIKGSKLYFSTNNPAMSLGAYDIVVSKLNQSHWEKPINLGSNINSSHNDTHFRFNSNGQQAFFTSDRIEGYGRRDLYQIYFSQKQSNDFYTSSSFAKFTIKKQEEKVSLEKEIEKKDTVISIPTFYYYKNEGIVNTINKNSLLPIIGFLKQNSSSNFIIDAHSDREGQRSFNLYYGLKEAEKVAHFMKNQGVPASRIIVRGCGRSFPSKNLSNSSNQSRIEFDLTNTNGITKIQTKVNDSYFQKIRNTLYYKVKILSSDQMVNHEVFKNFSVLTVEKNYNSNFHNYYLGIYDNYNSASKQMAELKKIGFTEATVVPFYEKQALNTNLIYQLKDKFPQLNVFLTTVPD